MSGSFKIRSALPYLLSGAVVLYLTFGGIYYEGALDTVIQTYVYGLFSGGSNAMPDTFGLFVLLSTPLNFLYRLFPTINWYDCFQAIILGACVCWLIKTLILYEKHENLTSLFLGALFFITIVSRILQPVELTKTAMLVAAISLIEVYRAKTFARYSLFGIFFLVALLMRVESGLLVFAIVAPFFFMDVTATGGRYKGWVQKTIFLSLLVGSVSLLVNIPKTPEEEYYLKIRAYEYSLTDFDREQAVVKLQNREDSVIFRSCVNFFFADSSRCNLAFFNKIGLLQFDKTPGSMVDRLQSISIPHTKWHSFIEVLKAVKWLLLILLCLLIQISASKFYSVRILIANLYALALMCFLSLWLKPEEHVVAPALAVLILLNLIWIRQHSHNTSRALNLFITIAAIGFISKEMYGQFHRMKHQRDENAYYNYVGNYLQMHSAENYLLNIGSWDEAHHKMFAQNNFAGLPKAYVIDGAILYFNGGYQKLIKNTTGSTKFIDQWQYFIDRKGSVFVSSEKRMAMLLEYMNVVYHQNYKAQRILQFNPADESQQKKALGLFVVRQMPIDTANTNTTNARLTQEKI